MENLDEIKEKLNTKFIGREIIYLEEIGSTQDYVKEKAKENAPNGLVVIAENQTKGKGTKGRTWYTKPRRKFNFFIFT